MIGNHSDAHKALADMVAEAEAKEPGIRKPKAEIKVMVGNFRRSAAQ
jgi:hypothetical protein